MGNRMTFQNIADFFSKVNGLTKKASEAFMKDFFDTVIDGLNRDGVVKINGFGTFKVVEVASRESVNVSNGERIVIKGYKKISFVPDETVNDSFNEMIVQIDSVQDDYENNLGDSKEIEGQTLSVGLYEETNEDNSIDEKDDILEGVALGEDEAEKKVDEFSGIDLLISTPETIEDICRLLDEKKLLVDKAIKEARENQLEVLRLQKLLENIKNNTVSEIYKDNIEEKNDCVEKAEQEEAVITESGCHEKNTSKQKSRKKYMSWSFFLLMGCIMAGLSIYIYSSWGNRDTETVAPKKVNSGKIISKKTDKSSKRENTVASYKIDTIKDETVKTVKDTITLRVDSLSKKTVSENKSDNNIVKARKQSVIPSEIPETHIIKPGETLSRLSRRYYGTRDSVPAIIKLNNFANPDNVPVGAVVKLPRLNK